jgi:hypothetical protein
MTSNRLAFLWPSPLIWPALENQERTLASVASVCSRVNFLFGSQPMSDQNSFLAALSASDLDLLQPLLTKITLRPGDHLQQFDCPVEHVIFRTPGYWHSRYRTALLQDQCSSEKVGSWAACKRQLP